jgi:hypothetical protein
MLETAATLTWEMKPWDMVSSFRGANTLFQEQQNKDRTQREERTDKEETHRRQITEGGHRTDYRREIKGATRDGEQRRSKDQSRGTRTALRHNVRGS